MSEKRARLKDVAVEAGVAVSTVSNILNGRSDSWASQKVRDRVFAAAEKLHYVPNTAARGLRLNRYGYILVILPDLTEPFFSSLARALHNELQKHGYETVFEETEFDPEQEKQLIENSPQRLTDGVIIAALNTTVTGKTLLSVAKQKPTVHLGPLPDDINMDLVTSDVGAGLRESMKHLKKLGHEKIGFVDTHFIEQAARFERFRRLLDEQGLNFDEAWWVRCSIRMEDTRKAVEEWACGLTEKQRPSALVCSGDSTAVAAMRGLQNAGIRVPEEMSIIGCNDHELSSYLPCTLTTIRQPVQKIAEKACELLLHRIEKKTTRKAERVIFPTELVIRESTVPFS